MGLSGLLSILVPFILLGGVQEPGLVEGFLHTCPKLKIHCDKRETNECLKDRQCPEKTKCCDFTCSMKCLNLKQQDICSLPKVVGPCQTFLPRWWYDKEARKCSKFMYGGCQANRNNFPSESICNTICIKKKGDCS